MPPRCTNTKKKKQNNNETTAANTMCLKLSEARNVDMWAIGNGL